MHRTTAVLLVLSASGLILASPYVLRREESDSDTGSAASRTGAELLHYPRGFIDADTLAPAPPVAWDARDDRAQRPYELLVRVLKFRDLTPWESGTERVQVQGARAVERIGPGEYRASDIDVALTQVFVTEPAEPGSRPGPLESGRWVASRFPIALARHAITTVDVLVLEPEDLAQPVEARGLVTDRFTGEPLEGAFVALHDGTHVLTGPDGRFAFDEPIELRQVLKIALGREDCMPHVAAPNHLSRAWVDHWRSTGDMTFTLKQRKEYRVYRPLRNVED